MATNSDMFCEPWMMQYEALESFFDTINAESVSVRDAMGAMETDAARGSYDVIDGCAVIEINGVLMQEVPWIARLFGLAATSYSDIQAATSAAINDHSVDRILYKIDSPGGRVAGAFETAEILKAAGVHKHTIAHCEGLCASAAFLLASQCRRVVATRSSIAGGIGVKQVIQDRSAQYEKQGVKVRAIVSGEHKGTGTPGTPLTEKQIGPLQEVVDQLAGQFIDAVAEGRGLSKDAVTQLATGREWLAPEAVKLGLIDAVGVFDESLKRSSANVRRSAITTLEKETEDMAEDKTEQATPDLSVVRAEAAQEALDAERKRIGDIAAQFGDDPDFAVQQIVEGATAEAAKANYADVLKEKLAARDAEVETLKAKKAETVTEPEAVTEGADPVAHGAAPEASQTGDFLTETASYAEEKGCSKTEAMKHIAKTRPELFAAYKAGIGAR